ncbi:hypothetical protein GCM10027215_34870 [Nocardioides zeae]
MPPVALAPAPAPAPQAPPAAAPAAARVSGPGRRRVRPGPVTVDVATAVAAVLVVVVADGPVRAAVVAAACWPVLGSVSRWRHGGDTVEAAAPGAAVATAGRAGTALAFVLLLVDVFLDLGPHPRHLLVLAALLAVLGALAGTTAARVARRHPGPLLVLGPTDQVVGAVAELARQPGRWTPAAVCLLGAVDRTTVARGIEGLVVVPSLDDVGGWLSTGGRGVLALPGACLHAAELRDLGRVVGGAGARLFVGTGLVDLPLRHLRSEALGGLRVLRVGSSRPSPVARAAKVTVERGAAVLGLIVLLPLLLVVAAAVRRDSAGPVLFRQTRVGLHGEPFTMVKFRTMHHGAEARRAALEDAVRSSGSQPRGVLFKLTADPRVTRVGRALRRWSLDELPQLVNVARGEMALVGPRPALPAEVVQYPVAMRRRLTVRPGITGLWQVSGRSDLSWEETVRLDLHYADHWSLDLDLRILVRTVGAVVSHRGAY